MLDLMPLLSEGFRFCADDLGEFPEPEAPVAVAPVAFEADYAPHPFVAWPADFLSDFPDFIPEAR